MLCIAVKRARDAVSVSAFRCLFGFGANAQQKDFVSMHNGSVAPLEDAKLIYSTSIRRQQWNCQHPINNRSCGRAPLGLLTGLGSITEPANAGLCWVIFLVTSTRSNVREIVICQKVVLLVLLVCYPPRLYGLMGPFECPIGLTAASRTK